MVVGEGVEFQVSGLEAQVSDPTLSQKTGKDWALTDFAIEAGRKNGELAVWPAPHSLRSGLLLLSLYRVSLNGASKHHELCMKSWLHYVTDTGRFLCA